MAEGERAGGVQGDLEKELTCSICTDLLYQPLTLLDCLHTFCGACLKEWFAFQASTATSIHPYTCPSCRASVRTTQPNATVTTLLDIFIKSNPERGKNDEEKQTDRNKYRPGDNVLPKLRRRDERDDVDQRMLEEAQQLSLRDAGIPGSSSSSNNNNNSNNRGPPRERRRRERSRATSRATSRESHRSRDERPSTSRNPSAASPARVVIPPRAIEHQSSLRSLLSSSDLDTEDVDEDLVRQVLEELVSEGFDLNQIGTAQEEEITERIAEAVRRRQAERHAERQRERRERRERLAREGLSSSSTSLVPQPPRSPLLREDDVSRRRGHSRSQSGTSTPQATVRPPISRPGLIDAANRGGRAPRQRSSSQGSSRSARRTERPTPGVLPANSQNTSGSERGSASDTAPPARRRQSDNQQRSRLDARQQFRNSVTSHTSSTPGSPQGLGFNLPGRGSPTSSLATVGTPAVAPSSSTPALTPLLPPTSRRTTDATRATLPRSSNSATPPRVSSPPVSRSTTDLTVQEPRSRQPSASSSIAPVLYTEPNIACQRCGKSDIQYELHYNCGRCDSGEYNICARCYRVGKGCKHWFGFGWTAWPRYEREAPEGGYPPNHEHPHILIGHRYRRPMTPLTESSTPPHVLMSEDDPKQRVEVGAFCDMCKAFANACYWKCDYCNEGDWGYCNDCVNQGRHCTHPLVPVARKTREAQTVTDTTPSAPTTPRQDSHLAPPDHDTTPTTPPLTPKSASLMRGPGFFTIANTIFRPLTFTTLCNVCRYPIPPSNTRYHCLKCNAGDYDICMSCYHKLVVSGRIAKEDGVNGWRKCLRSHRMYIVGFEDRDGAQRRMVVRDLVGGYALKEEEMMRIQRYPPDGGIGLRLLARWGYLPDEGVDDELSFPRGAEIREAADINGDWYWGVYCGVGKLFPANHVAAV